MADIRLSNSKAKAFPPIFPATIRVSPTTAVPACLNMIDDCQSRGDVLVATVALVAVTMASA